jgi:hypothetical protein
MSYWTCGFDGSVRGEGCQKCLDFVVKKDVLPLKVVDEIQHTREGARWLVDINRIIRVQSQTRECWIDNNLAATTLLEDLLHLVRKPDHR